MNVMRTLNAVVDLVVPVYAVVILVVLVMYAQRSQKAVNQMYTYTPKKKKGNESTGNWKDELTGYWNQCSFDDLDTWLKFMKKSLPVRMLGSIMLTKINNRITFSDDYTKLHFQRDFSNGPTAFDVMLTVGDPEFVSFRDEAANTNNRIRVYVNEEEQVLYMVLHSDGAPDTLSTRKILEDGTQENVTYGTWPSENSKCKLRTIFKKIIE